MALSRKYNACYILLLALLLSLPVLGQEDNIVEEPAVEEPQPAQVDNKKQNIQDEYLESDVKPSSFDKNTWEEKRKGMGFGEKAPEEKKKPKKEEEEVKKEDIDIPETPTPFEFGPVMQAVLIISVIALLALLVFVFIKQGWLAPNKSIRRRNVDGIDLDEIEENLHESDLERALRLALEANDYSLAIRIYYLSIIKELSAKNWIVWKRDKTNGQYVREMASRPNAGSFRQLTNAFDRVWYSDEQIQRRHYDVLGPQFQSFINSLKQAKP